MNTQEGVETIKVRIADDGGIFTLEEIKRMYERLIQDDVRDVESMTIMYKKYIEEQNIHEKPTMVELLLKKIVLLSMRESNNININFLAIPVVHISRNTTRQKSQLDTHTGSGPSKPFRPKRWQQNDKQESDGPTGSVLIIFDVPVLVCDTVGVFWIAPPNTHIYAIQLHIIPEFVIPELGAKMGVGFPMHLHDIRSISDAMILGSLGRDIVLMPNNRLCYKTQPQRKLDLSSPTIKDQLSVLFDYLLTIYDYPDDNSSVFANLITASVDNPKLLPYDDTILQYKPVSVPETRTDTSDKILKLIEQIHFGAFNDKSISSVYADVYGRHFQNIYNVAIVRGYDDKSVKTELKKYSDNLEFKKFMASNNNKFLEQRNKLNTYLLIFSSKSTTKRYKEVIDKITSNPSLIVQADGFLKLLTNEEKTFITNEYKRRQKYIESVIKNKCKHKELIRSLSHTKSKDKFSELFNDLLPEFLGPVIDNDFITCKVCNFNLLCPHKFHKWKAYLSNFNMKDTKALLSKFISNNYYCKICGELLVSKQKYDIITYDLGSTIDEELSKYIWDEISHIMNLFEFTVIVDTYQLIKSAVDAIYGFIADLQTQINKAKTMTSDESKSKMKLFTTVWIMAYFMNIILGQKNSVIKFKKITGNSPAEYIKQISTIIYSLRNVYIQKIQGVTVETIRSKLIDAFKSLKGATAVVSETYTVEDLLQDIRLDPILGYFREMAVLSNWDKKKIKVHYNLEDYMGVTFSKLSSTKDIYQYALDVDIPAKYIQDFKQFAAVNKDAHVNYNVLAGYRAECFKVLSESLKSNLILETVFSNVKDKKGDIMETFNKKHEEYIDKLRTLKQQENVLLWHIKRPIYPIPCQMKFNSGRWVNPNVSLGRLYDEHGKPHNWSLCILENNMEVKLSDMSKLSDTWAKIKDRKCTVCGMLKSQSSNLNNDKITKALDHDNNITNLFRYYENKCPEGGLHKYVDNKCTKCNIQNNDKSEIYFNKYYPIYYKERLNEYKVVFAPSVTFKDVTLVELDDWVFNYNSIAELANRISVDPHLILYMGSFEGHNYNYVISKEFIPAEPDSPDDTRIWVIDSRIRNLYREYNMLRFADKITNHPKWLSELITSSKLGRHRLIDLETILSDIYDDYNNKIKYVSRKFKPRNILNFCLQHLCDLCIKIYDLKTKEQISKLFVKQYIDKLIKADRLTTKPDYFNWSLLYPSKINEELDTNINSNDLSDGSDIDPSKKNKIDDDNENENPFSTDSLDIDVDPDDDPDDANTVKVDTDYGVD